MLDVPNILLGITAAVNVGLTWFVYERDRDNPINRLFALFVLFIAFWAFVVLLFRIVDDVSVALFLIKLDYVSALFFAFFFYHFAILFPHSEPPSFTHRVGTVVVAGFVAIVLILPGVLARGIVFHPWGKEVTLEPFAWCLFAIVFLFFFLGGQVRLLLKIQNAQGTERTQIVIIAAAVIAAGLFGMFYNLLLPSPLLQDFRYIWTGPIFTFLFAVVITYSIFRYKLFNPKAAVAELLVFTLMLLLLIRVMLASVPYERWIDGSLLAAVAIVGALLIRSVNSEIRQREVIQQQKEEIERASAEKS